MGNPGFHKGKPRGFAIFRGSRRAERPTYGLRYPDGGETSIRCVEKRAANGQYSLWGWDTARERQYDGQIRHFLNQPASRDGLTE